MPFPLFKYNPYQINNSWGLQLDLSEFAEKNLTFCRLRLFFEFSVFSQSVAIYLVDVLKENKHKLGQHKGQVKKVNINKKKFFYINKETSKNRLRSTSQAATLGSYCSNFCW